MKLKFPKLQNLVNSDKSLEFNHRSKLIHVIKGHAIVANKVIFAVDLREYIKIECQLETEEDFEELDELMIWLEGKSFIKDYWAELTSECFIKLSAEEDSLKIKYPEYDKALLYENIAPNEISFLDVVKNNMLAEKTISNDRVAIDFKYLSDIVSVFKKEFSNQKIIIEFTGKDGLMRFSGVRKSYIFGAINLSYDEANEFIGFQNVLNLGRELQSFLSIK